MGSSRTPTWGLRVFVLNFLPLLFRVTEASSRVCADGNNMCPFWAESGECEKNPNYMLDTCKLSCKRCAAEVELTGDGTEVRDASSLVKNPLTRMPSSENGGVVVTVVHQYAERAKIEVLWLHDGTAIASKRPVSMFSLDHDATMSLNTFENHVFSWRDADTGEELGRFRVLPARPILILSKKSHEMFKGPGCIDKSPTCPDRARRGECASSPGWMIVMCGKSCDLCHLRDPEARCARAALDMVQSPAIGPGDLDRAFRHVVYERPDLAVTVHSAPNGEANATINGPWVITIDDFVSEPESSAIVATVARSFSRSTDQGKVDEFGEQEKVVSTGRTSENAWCTGACESSPATREVMARIKDVINVPTENYESFQVLRYLPGQFYRAHHDMSGADNNLACGPRIYTFFLYFSDVEAGGETEFPNLRDSVTKEPLRIRPKRGTALWWPSVLSDDPTRQDHRTRHAALPVINGTKFAANAWIHNYDYATPNLWGCTGSFD